MQQAAERVCCFASPPAQCPLPALHPGFTPFAGYAPPSSLLCVYFRIPACHWPGPQSAYSSNLHQTEPAAVVQSRHLCAYAILPCTSHPTPPHPTNAHLDPPRPRAQLATTTPPPHAAASARHRMPAGQTSERVGGELTSRRAGLPCCCPPWSASLPFLAPSARTSPTPFVCVRPPAAGLHGR